MSTTFFKIESRSMIPGDWGDYGYTLQNGMAARAPNHSQRLRLERTGPFIPPISFPGIGDIVLTTEAKQLLDASALTGFRTQAVEKALIVELHWETWDLNAEQPSEFPESGEPEDYILGKAHSRAAAEALGELWEIVVPCTLSVRRPRSIVASYRELTIDLATWNGADLVRSDDYGSILFTQTARDWFVEHWGAYVRFDEFRTA